MPSRPGVVAFRAFALVVLIALTLAGVALPNARAAPPPFSVSVSATPSYGTSPLTVAFEASVSSGVPTMYEWRFGDGATFNGTNGSAAAPSHVYTAPGLYNASVVVTESSGSNSSSIDIHVVARPLSASVTASVPSGVAPLTETFSASVSGGTGTYVNLTWSFGDGNTGEGNPVQYTFETPGTYHVRFEVFDSQNASANASVWVNVSAADVVAPAPGVGAVLPWAVGGVAIGALAVWSLSRYRARASARNHLPRGTSAPADAGGVAAATAGPGRSAAPEPPVRSPEGRLPSPASPPEGSLRVSQRVILHLAQQGWLGENEVASVPFTQAGMSSALGIPQTSLTNVLRRLIAAGVISQDVRHVRGRDRRLKVYRLTPKGEALARDLAHPPR
jgi:PKD repeat protein